MISFGLIGFPLSHSLSPKLHEAAFKESGLQGNYRLYPVPPGDVSGLAHLVGQLRKGEIDGLNVTIPHKQSILPFLDDLSPSAAGIGAVNTLGFKDGRLIGENTDAPGFLADLRKMVPAGFSSKRAIVMGAGGAARAVVYALSGDEWSITLAVRMADFEQATLLISSFKSAGKSHILGPVLLNAEALATYVSTVDLIVNATPVGMHPETEMSPWPDEFGLPQSAVVYDLVYNPRETVLLRKAREAGNRAISGIGMLVEQAALSFEFWTGYEPSREVLLREVETR